MAGQSRITRGTRLGFAYRFAVALLWPFMRVMVKWEGSGAEKLRNADGGVVVAPNHTSWFDPLIVAFILWQSNRPPRFLAKESVFHVPVVGWIIKSAGQIPVHRASSDASKAIRSALAALERGECVVVYPEGTITRDPNLWPMTAKTGAVRMALTSGAPIYPLAHWGAQDVMGPYRKEFRILPRKTVRFVVGDPVDLADLMGRPINGATLAEGGTRMMDDITALLAQIRQEPPPNERMTFHESPDAA